MTDDVFVDSTTQEGVERIRGYALGWLERADYAGKLERGWPVEEIGRLLWARVEREFAPVWRGPVVSNRPLAQVIATSMVEDYFAAYPEKRTSRYAVSGALGDGSFRRCVVDFVHDLEEFDPGGVAEDPTVVAELFWDDVRVNPDRWGYDPERGPFVDDPQRARTVAEEAIREYFDLRHQIAEMRSRG